MQLAVLNPGGNDAEQLFPDGAGAVNDRVHAPVNYHAYAVCARGGFFRDAARIPSEENAVLLLLRRDLKPSLRALEFLKAAGKRVAISWKESGLHQVSAQLASAANRDLFRKICAASDGAISSVPELISLYQAFGAQRVAFIPTPYPVDDARWNFETAVSERRGIFIGTREFDVPSRNHLLALLLASSLADAQTPVTVFNVDGRSGRKQLAALRIPHLEIIEGRRAYSEYLRIMARHRLVLQLDQSAVPGQVAGDALLCRVPCVGGNSAIEQLAFSDLRALEKGSLMTISRTLLRDDAAYAEAVRSSQEKAARLISYAAVEKKLAAFFANDEGAKL